MYRVSDLFMQLCESRCKHCLTINLCAVLLDCVLFNCNSFDINKVLEFGALLASGGQVCCLSYSMLRILEGDILGVTFFFFNPVKDLR